ncbi:ABC transporter substrate-binding protein [Haliea sp. E1-2-M8]|uniref:ABC transporter substrate-binding protein n=1 Tax=Haliea sp. E1-2-M8 TaxID=3064706 RepID=UPI0027223486|nr:ABC transporter substrate-binding protein [Haliea sp. E1-2-M8]MDO8860349.1 ABC transporter substrate-binding protein [Haliea sp. E1-2-M8]
MIIITLSRVVRTIALLLACLSTFHAVAEHPDLHVRERVIIAGSVTLGDAPTRLADQLGLFAGAGAEVEVTSYSSGAAALNELLQRRADFALTSAAPFAAALLQQEKTAVVDGEELVVLARISRSNNTHHVVVASADADFPPGQLVGRRIGVMPGTTSEYFWAGYAPLHGIAQADVQLALLDVDAMTAALRARDIDAAVVWDPWPRRIRDALGGELALLSDSRIDSMSWLLVTRRLMVEQHPQLCDGILRAYLRAEEIIHDDPARARGLEADASGLSLGYVQRLAGDFIFSLGLDWSLLSEINHHVAWRLAQAGGDSDFVFAPERYLAPEPLARVAPIRMLLPRYWQQDAAR